ncbi:MAG: cation:proton antiporter [Rickettsiales bacterium]|jgi:CPA2 family monovalent cation:H+ antiporter-2|nr:cation:proton antiporter [Rickettsiales bacterium]
MEYTLIYTLIASIVTAFAFGMIAVRLKLPAILGYLLAGIAIGPNTPGFVADVSLAKQLAEIGIILLMFGVGLHFSVSDLLKARRVALPGALGQMLAATIIGALLAIYIGFGLLEGLIFGFSLSVASTIVMIRSLEQRRELNSEAGKIAISWLIIEDIAMVLALVMLPVAAEVIERGEAVTPTLLFATFSEVVFKIGGFFLFMFVVGRRFLPWLLVNIAKLRSSELSTLGTLAIALGFASIALVVFDASLALGAFLAGMMLSESEIGQKSAESSLPMRDAFSVLFFVSVGMLFDPMTLIEQPLAVVATFFIIIVIKSVVAYGIIRLFRQSRAVGYTVAVSLAQIGEFSFILGGLALTKGLLSEELYNLILAGAMLSIVANAFLFRLLDSAKKQA